MMGTRPPNENSGVIFNQDGSTDLALTDQSKEGGNSRPWSQNVYFKLFLDPEGIKANLLVVKVELTYTNLFTNQTHNLYKCRFIGGKNEGEQWVFDLMKSQWEPTVPSTDAAEVNYNVTMNFAPSKSTCHCLKSLIQLQKSLLRGLNFQGHVKVFLRFSHPTNWRDPDTQKALRCLFNSGVSFHVLSADDILNEMRADGIEDNGRYLGEFSANMYANNQMQISQEQQSLNLNNNNPRSQYSTINPNNPNNLFNNAGLSKMSFRPGTVMAGSTINGASDIESCRKFYVDKRLYWKAPSLNSNDKIHINLQSSCVVQPIETKKNEDNSNNLGVAAAAEETEIPLSVPGTSSGLKQSDPKSMFDALQNGDVNLLLDDEQQDYIRNKFPPEVVRLLDSAGHRLTAPEDKYQKWLTRQLEYVLGVRSNEMDGFTPAVTPMK